MTVVISGNNGVTGATWTTATRPSSPTQGQSGYNTTTNCVDTYNGSSWTSVPQPTSQGTSGQYLQSAGAGAAPTWATISIPTTSGTLIRAPQILTSGTSYTTPAGCNNILIELIGGGAGGGWVNRSNQGDVTGGGGGAGIYATKYVSVTPNTTYTYAIGSGGAGGSGGASGAGGNTTFTVGATTYTAGGGASVAFPGNNSNSSGSAAGTATNTDNSITPIAAGSPFGGMTLTPYGNSLGGFRNGYQIFNQSGSYSGPAGYGFGAGGGGGQVLNVTSSASGGAGYQGMIRITEFT